MADENLGTCRGEPPAAHKQVPQIGVKRSLETDAASEPARVIRLTWSAKRKSMHGCEAVSPSAHLVLDSFELVHRTDPASLPELACGTSLQACVAAASLLASLLRVPSRAIVTAEFPLVHENPAVLQPISPSITNWE
mmetsp:Transcript_1139/g.2434  ORF Transcript_1139/g.2434 Transcript_1139/m.2434 type:complete len:137 (-) Transcript_1139:162-572(-)|eukprot:CAMPEP_0181216622 /NCGR_PEP_ID=MMETSP1096-20121128/26693_1 /TAXON_ID=156174 ORGANISM="Chrysochromulina ericina, Strain CCMP281" /NCGR_SAMPLE_ID=MMETSP1096 /ASSEMBLY_ACC=CAM_ASM_000453 /LENGTH=136 /DNA_ID=CAMNT_0023308653 /DNA_START=57 /DNA_END=467 /DNA_ORIENTATION=+